MKRPVNIILLVLALFASGGEAGFGSGGKSALEKTAGYLNRQGLRFLIKEDYKKAKEFFLQAIRKDPDVKYFHNNLAAVYMKQGKYPEAYASLSRCLELDGRYIKALANMTVTAFRLGRYLESYHYYKTALKTDPAYTRRRFQKNRVVRYLSLLPEGEKEGEGFTRAVEYIKGSD